MAHAHLHTIHDVSVHTASATKSFALGEWVDSGFAGQASETAWAGMERPHAMLRQCLVCTCAVSPTLDGQPSPYLSKSTQDITRRET